MKIAVVGDVIIDEYVHGTVERISPEAPVPVLKYGRTEVKSGGAKNVYENIKALTDDVVMCTTNSAAPLKVRYMADGHYLLRVDYDDRGGAWETNDQYRDADIVVVSDYAKGALPSFSPYLGLKTIVDPKRSLEFYQGAWLLKPNRKEFEQYAGKWVTIAELHSMMTEARNRLDVQHLIVTLGEDGAAYLGDGVFDCIPSQAKEVHDVTGAGDTFTAVLAYCCASGMSVQDAIHFANKGSAVAVSHVGTYIVTKRDLGLHEDKTVVFTNGCFDILHPGHVTYLRQSKQLGDYLIVGLNSDESVRKLKGSDRPVNNQDTRKFMLEALGVVDEVIIFNEPTPYNLIKQIKPNIITKGGDYIPTDVVGYGMAEVVILPYIQGSSTTSIIERIRNDETTRDS